MLYCFLLFLKGLLNFENKLEKGGSEELEWEEEEEEDGQLQDK